MKPRPSENGLTAFLRANGVNDFSHVFAMALYGVFAIGCIYAVTRLAMGLGLDAITDVVSLICVALSALLLWPYVVSRGRANLRREVYRASNTITELLYENQELESKISRREDMLALMDSRLSIALTRFKISAFQSDLNHRYVWCQNFMLPDETVIGRTDHDILPEAEADIIIALRNRAIEDDQIHKAELTLVVGDGVKRTFCVQIASAKDASGEVIGTTMVSRDISKRVEQRDHLLMLLREINHRACNTLAVVASMCSLTRQNARSIDRFFDTLLGRINSLGLSLRAVSAKEWSTVDLEALVTEQLSILDADVKGRVTVEGPAVLLLPKAAQTFALVVHELSQFAIEAGIVTQSSGNARITWSIDQNDGVRTLAFLWTAERKADGLECKNEIEFDGFRRLFLESIAGRDLGGSSHLAVGPTCHRFELKAFTDFRSAQELELADNGQMTATPFFTERQSRQRKDAELSCASATDIDWE